MDADLTCEYCKGGGWFSDDAGRYRCQECWGHGRRPPALAEWDALAEDRDRLQNQVLVFESEVEDLHRQRDALRAARDRYRDMLEHIATTPWYADARSMARAALDRGTP